MTRERDLRLLPKAEMHLHLLGAMRESTLLELAAEAGLPAPDPRGFEDFAGFQKTFQAVYNAMGGRLENLLRLVREIVEDAAADGTVWVQPHFNPHVYSGFGAPDELMEAVLAEGRAAGEPLGVGFGITMAAMRHLGPESAERLAHFASRHAAAGVTAFGLTGDEAAFPPEPFAPAFAVARDAGLAPAPHAGELAGAESVRAAVEALGAARIAHGIRAVEDPALLELLAERGVALDVSLSSNKLLGVVPDLAAHPLGRLMEAGVPCTLGADDPLMFGAGVLDEYRTARSVLGLGDEQLAALARTSVATCGAPEHIAGPASAGVEAWLADGGH